MAFINGKDWKPYAIFAFGSLVVLGPLLKPGYILTLDMVFTPHMPMPTHMDSGWIFYALLHYLSLVITGGILEKIVLFGTFFVAGLSMYRFVETINKKKQAAYHQYSAYFAGLFYMINPFTYDRFMSGQYALLLGYALFPYFARALLIFIARPAIKSVLRVSAWSVVLSIVAVHTVGYMTIAAFFGAGLYLWNRKSHKDYMRPFIRYTTIGLVTVLVASSYWLVPLALGKSNTAHEISNFTTNDQHAFATTGGSILGKVANVIRLQGFWFEQQGQYRLPQSGIKAWGLLSVLIWVIVIVGSVVAWRSGNTFIVKWLVMLIITGIILGTGIAEGWLSAHVPLFAGYREPQKFVALITFGYAILGSWGITAIARYIEQLGETPTAAYVSIGFCMLIPLVVAAKLLWGANGQIAAVQYPRDWSTVSEQLDNDTSKYQTLFLPWHLYMYFDFAKRIIANPAPAYFHVPVTISDNPEIDGASATNFTSNRPIDTVMSNYHGTLLGAQLEPFHIKYILFARQDASDDETRFIQSQHDLQRITEGQTLEVYRNMDYKE